MRFAGTIAVLVLLLGFILVVQNTEVVSVRFLVWELSMSRILLLGGSIAIGFVAGFLVAKLAGLKRG